ncbi:MAG: signal peptidase I [Prevotella sp.]|nr:signal peptidase I [Prevotella sp.]MBR1546028.1 signal peptidase I [Prevotella sp.]
MSDRLKFVIALASAFVLVLAFRALAFSVYTVEGAGLQPVYVSGDRLLVNRWSYGLRVDGNGLLPYSRMLRQPVARGDIVLFDLPGDSIPGEFIARCTAVPGDTIRMQDGVVVVPGLRDCADADYYWLESIHPKNPADSRHLGFISEQQIIGRVVTILYSHDDSKNFLEGYRKERMLQ